MRSRHLLLAMLLAGTALPVAAAPDEPLSFEEKAKLSVRLRVLDLESRQLFKDYEAARQHQRQIQRAIRDVAQDPAGDPLTKQVKEAKQSAERIQQQMVDLEAERLKLLDRLGRKETAEPAGRADPTLEKILDVLMNSSAAAQPDRPVNGAGPCLRSPPC